MHDVVAVLATPVVCESDAPEVQAQLVEVMLDVIQVGCADVDAGKTELKYDPGCEACFPSINEAAAACANDDANLAIGALLGRNDAGVDFATLDRLLTSEGDNPCAFHAHLAAVPAGTGIPATVIAAAESAADAMSDVLDDLKAHFGG